jgi:hypothetical protein
LRIAGKMFGKHLDSDGAVESRVARAIDLAHAARPNWREDLVWSETSPRCQRHKDVNQSYAC